MACLWIWYIAVRMCWGKDKYWNSSWTSAQPYPRTCPKTYPRSLKIAWASWSSQPTSTRSELIFTTYFLWKLLIKRFAFWQGSIINSKMIYNFLKITFVFTQVEITTISADRLEVAYSLTPAQSQWDPGWWDGEYDFFCLTLEKFIVSSKYKHEVYLWDGNLITFLGLVKLGEGYVLLNVESLSNTRIFIYLL